MLSLRRGFPKKASRTARIASDEEIQGTKDAVIQDLERKLRFKEDLLNNGQPVLREEGFRLRILAPHSPDLFSWFIKAQVHKTCPPDGFITPESQHSS